MLKRAKRVSIFRISRSGSERVESAMQSSILHCPPAKHPTIKHERAGNCAFLFVVETASLMRETIKRMSIAELKHARAFYRLAPIANLQAWHTVGMLEVELLRRGETL
jgi:hypothetical protein